MSPEDEAGTEIAGIITVVFIISILEVRVPPMKIPLTSARRIAPLLLWLTASLLLPLLSSCENPVAPPPSAPESAVFPDTVGTVWTYEKYSIPDSLRDTVTVSITGTRVLDNGDTATIWVYRSLAGIDTELVTRSGDLASRYVHDSTGFHLTAFYLFPLSVGKVWTDALVTDTSRVTEKGALTVPAGTFPEVYHITRSYPGHPGYEWISTWFAPNVGIIKWVKMKYDFGPFSIYGIDTYTLIAYRAG